MIISSILLFDQFPVWGTYVLTTSALTFAGIFFYVVIILSLFIGSVFMKNELAKPMVTIGKNGKIEKQSSIYS